MSLTLTTLLLLSGAPRAQLSLTHVRGPGSESCPDEAALRRNVSARLGYDPFSSDAALRAITRLDRAAKGFTATLELLRDGEAPRRRTLDSPSNCADVFEPLALALTLAVDPQFLTRAPPPPEPPPPAPVAEAPVAAPAPAAAPSTPVELSAYLTGMASAGLSPAPTGGGELGIGLGYGAFALYLEGRVDLPSSIQVVTGAVRTNLFMASLLPCFEWRGLGACLNAGVGALQVEGQLSFGRRDTRAVVKIGGRLKYRWVPLRHFGLVAHLDVGAIPTRVTVIANNASIWSTGFVAAELGLGIVVPF